MKDDHKNAEKHAANRDRIDEKMHAHTGTKAKLEAVGPDMIQPIVDVVDGTGEAAGLSAEQKLAAIRSMAVHFRDNLPAFIKNVTAAS